MGKTRSNGGALGLLIGTSFVNGEERVESPPFTQDLLNPRAHCDMLLEKSNDWENEKEFSEKIKRDVFDLIKLYCRHSFENE
ncbi:MAG: hypothetical protein N2234_02275 [Planctomycetota bacterium]|nr:hypothetical protein [Planctomycetota bacterium]